MQIVDRSTDSFFATLIHKKRKVSLVLLLDLAVYFVDIFLRSQSCLRFLESNFGEPKKNRVGDGKKGEFSTILKIPKRAVFV